mgnify:CR=1 FL=1
MPTDRLTGLALFAFVMSITPGPNNLMALTSGANFGFRRTTPHMLGVALGFAVMAALVGLGVGQTLMRIPLAHEILRWGGLAYMLFLAARLLGLGGAGAGGQAAGAREGRPMRFAEAAAFQWVNPKAWVAALGAVATYVGPGDVAAGALMVGAVFALVCLPCIAAWGGFGAALSAWLAAPGRMRLFNTVMAGLLLLSLAPIVFE